MLVEIDPPFIAKSSRLGGDDASTLLLVPRHKGYSLFPIVEWPTFVNVGRVREPKALEAESLTFDQVQMITWAELFENVEGAYARAESCEHNLL